MRRLWICPMLVLLGCGWGEGAAPNSAADLPQDFFRTSEHPIGREWRASQDWLVSSEEQGVLYDTWQQAISDCMAEAGFNYQPVAFVGREVGVLANPLNEAVAVELGYHIEVGVPQIENPNLNESQSFNAALEGFGEREGCGASTRRQVLDPVQDYVALAESTIADLESELQGFDETAPGSEAIAAWSACMVEDGYPFSTPREPRDLYGRNPDVSEEELAVRARDLECDKQVRMTEQRSDSQRDVVEAWVSRNEGLLIELRDLRHVYDDHIVRIQSGQ